MARLKDRLAVAANADEVTDKGLLSEGAQRFANIPLEFIEPDPDQPRKNVGDISELKESIAAVGIIQPIVVSPHGADRFRIIAGERRFTAAKALELQTVPAIIRTIELHRRLEVQLIENIHRQELNPVEEAQAYRRLMDEFSLSQRQLAERIGKSLAGINQTLRILSLPEDLIQNVQTSEHLSRSVLLEIAKLESEDDQRTAWTQAVGGNLTVKAARQKKTGKAPTDTHQRFKVPFKTQKALITVVFEVDEPSIEQVIDALSEALKEARKRAKESAT